jgi:hypothetical protein
MFAGGLASIFPGRSTVESDFSVISCEKDKYRTSLTNFFGSNTSKQAA